MSFPVLVLPGTGRVGNGVVRGLRKEGFTQIFATSRSEDGCAALKKHGALGIKADYTTEQGVIQALKESKAQHVFFLTDYFGAAGGSKEKEIEQGKLIIDTIKAHAPRAFVVFSSVFAADTAPAEVEHFGSKKEVEDHLKTSGLSYAIERPVAFLENLDDAAAHNPLKKGRAAFLTNAGTKVAFISTIDMGRAAAVMFRNPSAWNTRTLDAVSCVADGNDLAKALSKASGTECYYSKALPQCVLWLLSRELYAMINYFESEEGFRADPSGFRKVVPDALGPEEWFRLLGQWGNGEKFVEDEEEEEEDEKPWYSC